MKPKLITSYKQYTNVLNYTIITVSILKYSKYNKIIES